MPSELPDSFQCGPFVKVSNPDAGVFVDKLNRLREAVDQCRIQPGVGYTFTRSSGGTSLTIKTGSGSSAAEVLHPFKIKIRQKDKKYQFFVIQGAAGNNSIIASNQEKWVDFKPPARIYLEATISNNKNTSSVFKSIAPDQTLESVTIEGGGQTKSRITVGLYVDPDGKENYQIIQNVKTNIIFKTICADGYPALFMVYEYLV